MPELGNAYLDLDYERFLFDLRRRVPDRFVVTHADASMFIEELLDAAHASRLNIIEEDGLPFAYSTNDSDKLSKYKSLVDGWAWQVHDKADDTFTEAGE